MTTDMFDDVRILELRLGIPVGFSVKLLNSDDDWSFIIK